MEFALQALRRAAGGGPSGGAQSLKQSSLRCGTRFVDTAGRPYKGRGGQVQEAGELRAA